jgi:hypothetical protein
VVRPSRSSESDSPGEWGEKVIAWGQGSDVQERESLELDSFIVGESNAGIEELELISRKIPTRPI